MLGTTAVIVMPEDTPAASVAATAGYGAEIVTYDRYSGDREAIWRGHWPQERGLHARSRPTTTAGHGRSGHGGPRAVRARSATSTALVVPVGGGGLIAGCATAATGVCPGDPGRRRGAGGGRRHPRVAWQTGERVPIQVPRTIADGQQADIPGELTFEVNRRLVDEVVTVTDDEIVDAMALLFERLKVVAEPSGAIALAALRWPARSTTSPAATSAW